MLKFSKKSIKSNPLIIDTSIEENILLKNGDHITVPRSKMLEQIESVVITGEIMVPGIYPVNKLTTLSDILLLSGGLNDMTQDGIEIFRTH